MTRRRNPFPGVSTKPDRHGKLRHRLRKKVKGRKIDLYIDAPYGSAEFRAAYEAAINGERSAAPKAEAGTIAFLIEDLLASDEFRDLRPSTRATKRARLDWIKATVGAARFKDFLPRHVEALMQKKGGPVAANRLKKDLHQLFKRALRHNFRGENPTRDAKSRTERRDGYHTFTDAEIADYRAFHPSGSKARLAFEIMLCTGAARQDAAGMTRANIRGARIVYRRGKTGQEVDLPILPSLARELALLPRTQMMLIAHGPKALGYTPESFGNWFRDRCNEAGLPNCSAHGLRKAGARMLAEAGGTEFEVMSFLGHATARMASVYVAAANRARLATSGMAKLRAEPEQDASNLPEKLDKSGG